MMWIVIYLLLLSRIIIQQIVSPSKKWWQNKTSQTFFIHPAKNWSPTLKLKLDDLLTECTSQFEKDKTSIGTTPLTEMTIDTGSPDPVSQKPYPIAMKNYQWVKEEIEQLLTAKVIHISRSSWSVSIIGSTKGWWRKMISHWLPYTLQSHQEIHLAYAQSWRYFLKIKWCKVFSTLDLWAGYHHIPLDKS